MRNDEDHNTAADVADLGQATVLTLGVWDPLLKESHDTPESFM